MLPVEIEELKHSKAGKLVRLFQGFKGSGAGSEDESEFFFFGFWVVRIEVLM